ncbi:MAG: hypothetical protein LUQ25_08145 [Methanoregulaceae archaeon]|nr:hypothetical protein [Methanoregulaceae archaeon]
MQNNNPYDDFLRNIAKLVEEIMKTMPDRENTRFVGCTIIAGTPSDMPMVFHVGKPVPEEVSFEMIESDDSIFITAEIPPDIESAPYADITPDHVGICIGEQTSTIPFETPVDVIHSFYMVRHGVMDIIIKKRPVEEVGSSVHL